MCLLPRSHELIFLNQWSLMWGNCSKTQLPGWLQLGLIILVQGTDGGRCLVVRAFACKCGFTLHFKRFQHGLFRGVWIARLLDLAHTGDSWQTLSHLISFLKAQNSPVSSPIRN